MIRRLSTEPQIPEVQSHEVEHIERERTIPQQETSHELERPTRSDKATLINESNLSGETRQASLDKQLIQNRADAIHNASEGLGTDEAAIFRSLSGLNQQQRTELNEVYKQKYGMRLEDQLRKEMSGPELEKGLNLLHGNGHSPVKQSVASRADAIHKACEGLGTDEQSIFRSLSGMNAEERKELDQIYRQKFGIGLEDQLKDENERSRIKKSVRSVVSASRFRAITS